MSGPPSAGRGRGRPPGGGAGRGTAQLNLVPGAPPGGQPAWGAADAAARRPGAPNPGMAAGGGRGVVQKVSDQLHQSEVFRSLVDLERRVDALIERRRTEIQDAYRTEERKARTLRLVVFNTAFPGGGTPSDPPYWTLCLHGHLVDSAAGQGPPLTALVDRLTVQLDPGLYPGDEGTVTWRRDESGGAAPAAWPFGKDQFSLTRPGTGPCRCVLTLQLAHTPARMQLPGPMAHLLGLKTAPRVDVIHALWLKIRALGLLAPGNASLVNVDAHLSGALGLQPGQLPFTDVVTSALAQLQPPPPVVLQYTIRTDGTQRLGGDTYECEVDVPDGRGAGELPAAAAQLLRGLQTQSAEFEARAAVQLAKLNELKRRRAFLLGFATSPGDFINAIIASQARDLQVMQNGAVRARDLELRTEFYRQPWVDDAVMQYLARTEQEQQAQQQAQQAKQQAQQAQQAQAMQQ